jgi:hypothetical protein
MGAVTLIVTVEDVEAEPPGRLLRAMVRRAGQDVELIGPQFVPSAADLRDHLAAVVERMMELLAPGGES